MTTDRFPPIPCRKHGELVTPDYACSVCVAERDEAEAAISRELATITADGPTVAIMSGCEAGRLPHEWAGYVELHLDGRAARLNLRAAREIGLALIRGAEDAENDALTAWAVGQLFGVGGVERVVTNVVRGREATRAHEQGRVTP